MRLSENQHLVFVSHSGEDTWVARQIAQEIEATGAKSFLDEADIKIADRFDEIIRDNLNHANELLVLLTPWALGRPFVWIEIGVAYGRDIPIVTVLHGLTILEFIARTDVPVFLKNRDMIRLNDIDQYFSELQIRVSAGSKK